MENEIWKMPLVFPPGNGHPKKKRETASQLFPQLPCYPIPCLRRSGIATCNRRQDWFEWVGRWLLQLRPVLIVTARIRHGCLFIKRQARHDATNLDRIKRLPLEQAL